MDTEKSLGVTTGLKVGLVAYGLLALLVAFIYFVFFPMLKYLAALF